MAESPLSHRQFVVAVIFAMEVELNAFRFMLDEVYRERPPRRPDDPNRYFFGRIGPHNVVLARSPDIQGKGAAATVVANLSRTFPSIQWRLLVGVGGGVPGPRHDIQLGDVVVSMPTTSDTHGGVVQYDLGRGADEGYQRKGFLKQPPAYLVATVSEMKANHMEGLSKIKGYVQEMLSKSSEIRAVYEQPDRSTDVLYPEHVQHVAGMSTCEQCDRTHVTQRPDRTKSQPKIHYGLVASGDEVVVSIQRRNEFINRVDGDVLCFEMEAAGIATEYPCLVIRGISDYADPHKTKGWQPYASATAAACAKELLYLIEPHDAILTNNADHINSKTSEQGVIDDRKESLTQLEKLKNRFLKLLDFGERGTRKNDIHMEQPGTCEWFLKTDLWEKWYCSLNPNQPLGQGDRLICIRGKPGAGKSTLMKYVLGYTRKNLDLSKHVVISHFFNARGTQLERSVAGMYRTLLSELVAHLPPDRLEGIHPPPPSKEHFRRTPSHIK